MTGKGRKIFGAISGVIGIVFYIAALAALRLGPQELLAIRDGSHKSGAVFTGIGLLILSLSLILIGRLLFGNGGHKRSRTAAAFALAALPLEKLLLFGLRWYVVCMSELSGKIAQIFVRNTGVLEGILMVGTLVGGLLAVLSRRASEYGDNIPGKAETQLKSGFLGMLGMAGYDICDVILTSYDGVKTAILVFESDAAWKDAVERGIDQEIVAACKKVEPGYAYTFEAKE